MSDALNSVDLPDLDAVPVDAGAAHLDSFVAPELEAAGGGADDVTFLGEDGEPLPDEVAKPEMMSRDLFWEMFRAGFSAPTMISADFAPLAIASHEEVPARTASDAVYSLVAFYFPKALIPLDDKFEALFAAAPFFFAKAMVVRAILEDRRAKKARPVGQGPEEPSDPPENGAEAPEPAFSTVRKPGAFDWLGDG